MILPPKSCLHGPRRGCELTVENLLIFNYLKHNFPAWAYVKEYKDLNKVNM